MPRIQVMLAMLGLAAPVLLSGCGTMIGNPGGLSRMNGHYLEPYGGVKICLEAGASGFKEMVEDDKEASERITSLLAASYRLASICPSALSQTL